MTLDPLWRVSLSRLARSEKDFTTISSVLSSGGSVGIVTCLFTIRGYWVMSTWSFALLYSLGSFVRKPDT